MIRARVFAGLMLGWPGVALAASDAPAAKSFPDVAAVFTTPISPLIPGDPPPEGKPGNPAASDPSAIERGMHDFVAFNCVGCHAPNGGGGMGPSLSNDKWIYGSAPSDIFLTIFQGRANGMPAWGETLPMATIWDLVAYVQSIAEKSGSTFGRTISHNPDIAARQQTPAEFLSTTDPWRFTEPSTNGQKPKGP